MQELYGYPMDVLLVPPTAAEWVLLAVLSCPLWRPVLRGWLTGSALLEGQDTS